MIIESSADVNQITNTVENDPEAQIPINQQKAKPITSRPGQPAAAPTPKKSPLPVFRELTQYTLQTSGGGGPAYNFRPVRINGFQCPWSLFQTASLVVFLISSFLTVSVDFASFYAIADSQRGLFILTLVLLLCELLILLVALVCSYKDPTDPAVKV